MPPAQVFTLDVTFDVPLKKGGMHIEIWNILHSTAVETVRLSNLGLIQFQHKNCSIIKSIGKKSAMLKEANDWLFQYTILTLTTSNNMSRSWPDNEKIRYGSWCWYTHYRGLCCVFRSRRRLIAVKPRLKFYICMSRKNHPTRKKQKTRIHSKNARVNNKSFEKEEGPLRCHLDTKFRCLLNPINREEWIDSSCQLHHWISKQEKKYRFKFNVMWRLECVSMHQVVSSFPSLHRYFWKPRGICHA